MGASVLLAAALPRRARDWLAQRGGAPLGSAAGSPPSCSQHVWERRLPTRGRAGGPPGPPSRRTPGALAQPLLRPAPAHAHSGVLLLCNTMITICYGLRCYYVTR
eukprot:7071022-Pyramimonas_sp.AAC.1